MCNEIYGNKQVIFNIIQKMLYSTRGIVIQNIKYSESSVISHIYTEQFGRKSYLISGIRKSGKNKKGRMALIQPLSILTMEVYENQRKSLQRIKEFEPEIIFNTIPYDFNKRSIALFIAEILYKVLKEQEPNTPLFSFLYHFIQILDETEHGISNIHLIFMMQLSKHLGFYPRFNYSTSTPVFDLTRGYFMSGVPEHPHYLSTEESYYFSHLSSFTFKNFDSLSLPRHLRNNLLIKLIEFYKVHIQNFGELKSYKVLKDLYG